MSEEENNIGQSSEEKVVLSSEDIKNVREYFKHFDIPLPNHLDESLDKFENSQTLENQKFLKLQMCKVLIESPHESFKDGMFDTVKETAGKARYDLQFEFDVKDELTHSESTEESTKESTE